MTTPEQITKWREEFETNHKPQMITRYVDGSYQLDYMEDMWTGYLRACTERAGEIAELKAKLTEAESKKLHGDQDAIEGLRWPTMIFGEPIRVTDNVLND